jgi:PAS domain S-box-containing protein
VDALLESEQRYAAIFEHAPFAIALTRLPDGVTISVNDAFVRLFEFSRDEVIGKTSRELGITDDAGYARVAAELAARGVVRDLHVARRTRSGAELILSLNVDLTTIAGERFALTTIQDVTERERAQAALREALQAREDFISIAAHELKTPLTSMRLQAGALERSLERGEDEQPLRARVARVAGVTIRQVERLDRLVDDMLDSVRISSGRLPVRLESVDLDALTRSCLDRLHTVLHEAGCDVRYAAEPGLGTDADAFRIDQVVTNLLSNVIKYAAGAPVDVAWRRDGGEAVLTVRDGGPGIAKPAQAHIFERFVRAVPHTHTTGLGLGLFIADQIVRMHGGRIEVESDEGAGATFTVRLPMR